MATINEMRQVATQIENETQVGGNTASRVGGLFNDVVDKLEDVDNVTPFDNIPTKGSVKGVKSGGVYSSNVSLKLGMTNLHYKTQINTYEIKNGYYINSNGVLTSAGGSFKVCFYEVDEGADYLIHQALHTGIAASFAVYTSNTYDTCVQVGDVVTATTGDELLTTIPVNGKYLGISIFNNSAQSLQKIGGYIDVERSATLSEIHENDLSVIKPELFPYVTAEKDGQLTSDYRGKYISSVNGDLGSLANYKPFIYEVHAGDLIKIIPSFVSANKPLYPCYGLYSATPFSSSTCITTGKLWRNLADGEIIYLRILQDCFLFASRYPSGSQPLLCNVQWAKGASKITEISNELQGLDERVDIVEENVYINEDVPITQWTSQSQAYINANGNISTFNGYRLDYFPVTAGEKYKIKFENGAGIGRSFAVYSSSSFSSSTLIPPLGREMQANSGNFTEEITIPTGGQYLAVGYFNNVTRLITKKVSTPVNTEVVQLNEKVAELGGKSGNIAVKLDENGEDLYAAYLDNNGTEIIYWFKKCMANLLYTFYRVGYRVVTRSFPSTEGINTGTFTTINETGSDNIGPLNINPGGWCGGNHHYPNETASPKYLTAQNDSYACYADGKLLMAGDETFCNVLSIKVVNTIFDPSIAPSSGATSLSTPLSTETVQYTIRKNTIEVSCRQNFVDTTSVNVATYYGMQSMFKGESEIITPRGLYSNWNIPANVSSFNKSDYPNFNRFVEKSSTYQSYQAAYLYPVKLGTHSRVSDSDWIFSYSSGKCYHRVMSWLSNSYVKGETFVWNGGYTFFHTPIIDDANVFAYTGVLDGNDAVFIASKQACSIDIELPQEFLMRKIDVVESDNITTNNVATDVCGLHVDATNAGSLIITLY